MVDKYKKVPVVIEALEWNGNNKDEVMNFVGSNIYFKGSSAFIVTLEGDMEASVGDYIIKGVKGEFYPCKPDVFSTTYEKVSSV